MPLARRLPKRGFTSPRPNRVRSMNIGDLVQRCAGATVLTLETIRAAGCLADGWMLKVLGEGTVSSAIEVHAHAFSRLAREKIEKAGGKAVVVRQT